MSVMVGEQSSHLQYQMAQRRALIEVDLPIEEPADPTPAPQEGADEKVIVMCRQGWSPATRSVSRPWGGVLITVPDGVDEGRRHRGGAADAAPGAAAAARPACATTLPEPPPPRDPRHRRAGARQSRRRAATGDKGHTSWAGASSW